MADQIASEEAESNAASEVEADDETTGSEVDTAEAVDSTSTDVDEADELANNVDADGADETMAAGEVEPITDVAETDDTEAEGSRG